MRASLSENFWGRLAATVASSSHGVNAVSERLMNGTHVLTIDDTEPVLVPKMTAASATGSPRRNITIVRKQASNGLLSPPGVSGASCRLHLPPSAEAPALAAAESVGSRLGPYQ